MHACLFTSSRPDVAGPVHSPQHGATLGSWCQVRPIVSSALWIYLFSAVGLRRDTVEQVHASFQTGSAFPPGCLRYTARRSMPTGNTTFIVVPTSRHRRFTSPGQFGNFDATSKEKTYTLLSPLSRSSAARLTLSRCAVDMDPEVRPDRARCVQEGPC